MVQQSFTTCQKLNLVTVHDRYKWQLGVGWKQAVSVADKHRGLVVSFIHHMTQLCTVIIVRAQLVRMSGSRRSCKRHGVTWSSGSQ